jgi:hypothetical protein
MQDKAALNIKISKNTSYIRAHVNYAGISGFPGGSTPGPPRGFVKTALTKGH